METINSTVKTCVHFPHSIDFKCQRVAWSSFISPAFLIIIFIQLYKKYQEEWVEVENRIQDYNRLRR